MSEEPLLEVRDLAVRFPTSQGVVHAVSGVSFDVGRGQIVGIVGETGCGKSVTMRSVVGLVRPPGEVTAGTVVYDGTDLRRLSQRALRQVRGVSIGFIPQNPWGALNPVLRIERQMHNVLKAHGIRDTGERNERCLDVLGKVGLPDPARILKSYAHELSGGMAQRVVIATSLLHDPRLLIADEPTTGLDVTIQRQILDLITGLVNADGRSMLIVTHDIGVVAQYCHDVVVMYAGKVVESGAVTEVFGEPAHPYTKALLDSIPRPGHELVTLPGRIPDLIDYPEGCPFRERCAHAFEPCGTVAPAGRALASGSRRQYSCHLDGGVTSAHAAVG